MRLLITLAWTLTLGKFVLGLTFSLGSFFINHTQIASLARNQSTALPALKTHSRVKLRSSGKPALCGATVPGLEKMIKGVDMTKLDLYPKSTTNPKEAGFCEPIFEFTFDQSKTWTSPSMGHSYPLPDQVNQIIDIRSGKATIESAVHNSLHSVKQSMSAQVSMKIGLFGTFSSSASYSVAKESMLEKKSTYAETTASVSLYQVVLRDGSEMHLSRQFLQELSQLPAKFETNHKAYYAFLDKFGTHYFAQAYFGGTMHMRATMSSELSKSKTTRQIGAGLKAKFSTSFGVDAEVSAGVSVGLKNEQEKFEKETTFSLQHYGGKYNSEEKNQTKALNEWFTTVQKLPWLYGGSVVSITEVIPDENKRKQMQKAIQVQGLKAYVDDFRDVMIKGKLEADLSQQDKAEFDTIQKYVNDPGSVEEAQLEKFGKSVDDLFAKFQALRDMQVVEKCYKRLVDLYKDTASAKLKKAEQCSNKKLKKQMFNLEEQRHRVEKKLAKIKVSYKVAKQLPSTDQVHNLNRLTWLIEREIKDIKLDNC